MTDAKNDIELEENEEPVWIEVEKPKVDVKKDDLDGSVAEDVPDVDDAKADDEDEDKPKFKPELFPWTSYDGRPRNYIQNLLRFTKYPLEEKTIGVGDFNHTIYETVEGIIQNKQSGIHLIKINK